MQDYNLTIDQIRDLIDDCGFAFIGIRRQEPEFELGPVLHDSMVWVDNEMTDESLNGICALDVDVLERHCNLETSIRAALEQCEIYDGEHVAIIGSDSAEWGEDSGERVMQDAEVVAILS